MIRARLRIAAQHRVPRAGNAGFTVLEALIATSLMAAVFVITADMQVNLLSYDRVMHAALSAQQEARRSFALFTTEARIANVAETGAYPIAAATATSFTFYSDADASGTVERYRYFVQNGALNKGVTQPSGSPLAYVDANEVVTPVVTALANGAVPVFEYYPAAYAGTGSSMSSPVNVALVRMVKITVVIDREPAKPPAAQTFSTQVMLRNLKDNL